MDCDCRSKSPISHGSVVHCSLCRKVRWGAEDKGTKLYKIPTIEDGMLCEERDGGFSNPFFREIQNKPKRTRLSAIEHWLPKKPQKIQQRLDLLNVFVSEFGLKLERIYPEGKIVQDDSLLLCSIGWSQPEIEINECTDGYPKSKPGGVFWQDEDNLDAFRKLGKKLLGGYKEQQEEAIQQSLQNPGSLLITALPTGFGKTRIGQVITWLNRRKRIGGPTLFISPLIALMDDQREQFSKFNQVLEDNGFKTLNCYFLTSAEETPYEEILQKLKNDEVDVLCCSPETLLNPVGRSHWVEIFLQMSKPFSAMVVDEAHMVGEWGASIRPEFQLLGWVKDRLLEKEPNLRVVLMSATITKSEEKELKKLFKRGLESLPTIREPKIREDLSFNVIIEKNAEEEDFCEEWVDFLRKERARIPAAWFSEQANKSDVVGRPPLLIYTPKKKFAESELKQIVQNNMFDGNNKMVRSYTGETSSGQRNKLREDFVNDRIRALVATSAFGMGIDKTDVWTIAYFGMPHSLKGLYQGFGRAARGSNWKKIDDDGIDIATSQLRSGNCLAVIPNKPPRNFKPELGKMKAMERIFDMFLLSNKTIFSPNGYAVVQVIPEDNSGAYWTPTKETVYIDDENEDDTKDDWSIEQELNAFGALKQEERRKKDSQLRRKQALFQHYMWTIACLQRTEDVDFMGLHPPVLSRNRKTGKEFHLIDALNRGGYSEVLSSLADGKSSNITMPGGQNRLAVLRFRKGIYGFSDLKEIALSGHKYLHDRHTRGREELQKFLNQTSEGMCLRKSLAPAIGVESTDVPSCLETDRSRLQMPCNNCRGKMGFDSLDTEGFLWSEMNTIMKIQGERIREKRFSLENATRKEMRDLVLSEDFEALISRKEGETTIPSRISNGKLKKIGKLYPLYGINGEKIGSIKVKDGRSFSEIRGVWPMDSTAILIFSGRARVVTDAVCEMELD